jgi:hypothetical protein
VLFAGAIFAGAIFAGAIVAGAIVAAFLCGLGAPFFAIFAVKSFLLSGPSFLGQ